MNTPADTKETPSAGGRALGEPTPLEVEFRGEGREGLAVDAPATPQDPLDDVSAVAAQAAPDHHEGALELAPQVPEVPDDLRGGEVGVGLEPEVQPDAPPARRQGEGRGGTDPAVQTGLLGASRGVPPRSPGAAHERPDPEAALVDRDQDGVRRAGDIHRRDAVVEKLQSATQESRARRACG